MSAQKCTWYICVRRQNWEVIPLKRIALSHTLLIGRCIHRPMSRCSHLPFLSPFSFFSPIWRPEDLPLFLEVISEADDATVGTYRYAWMVAFTTLRVDDAKGRTKFSSGKCGLIDMKRLWPTYLSFLTVHCRHIPLSSYTLPVRSFSIHSALSFSTPIVVVFLSSEMMKASDDQQMIHWSVGNSRFNSVFST